MPYSLHDGHRIGLLFRVLTEFYQFLEKLFGIGHVKISSHDEVAVNPVVLSKKRMNIFYAVFPKSSIADMP